MAVERMRCQSCGMPLGEFRNSTGETVSNFGTNQDGSSAKEYCQFCFREGNFIDPDMTLEQMIQLSVEHMTAELKMPLEEARQLAQSVIPNLRRWT